MDQRTTEWHQLRKGKIGASEAPVVLGTSPWQTRYQLWAQKTGRAVDRRQSNWAIERGNRWEPAARARYELKTGYELPPSVVVSKKYPFLMCSTDGHSEELGIVLEIKIPGRDVFEAAKRGVVHEKYKPQVYHQLIVTDAKQAHFYCCKVEKINGVECITDDALVVVERDEAYERELLMQLKSFWDFVQRDLPPPVTGKDIVILDDQSSVELFSRLKTLKEKLQEVEMTLQVAKAEFAEAERLYTQTREEAIEHVTAEGPTGHGRFMCLDVLLAKDKNGVWSVHLASTEKHQTA